MVLCSRFNPRYIPLKEAQREIRYVSAGQSRPLHRLRPVPPTKLPASNGSKAGWCQWPASPGIAPAWIHGEANRRGDPGSRLALNAQLARSRLVATFWPTEPAEENIHGHGLTRGCIYIY